MNKINILEWIDLLNSGTAGVEVDLPVLSGSMDPILPPGKTAVIRKLSKDEIKKLHRGAIIVYRQKYKLIAHRMIAAVPFTNYIYEKGDRNSSGSFVYLDNILGVVVSLREDERILTDFFAHEEIKKAKRESFRNLLKVLKYYLLILPRRVKNVLEKK